MKAFFKKSGYKQWIDIENKSLFSCTCPDFTFRGSIKKIPCKHIKSILKLIDKKDGKEIM